MTATKMAEMAMATANEPSPALMWLSSVDLLHPREARADQRADADQRHAAHPGRQAALDQAGAVQHGWRRSSRRTSSSPETSPAAAAARRRRRPPISTASSSGEAIGRSPASGAVGAMPVSASTSGSAAVRMITRMVCTTAIAGDVGALLGGEHRDLRQRAGAAGQQRRGLVPAVDALQVDAGAEGRAEGRERQQADGQRIGAHVLDQLPRHQRAQR